MPLRRARRRTVLARQELSIDAQNSPFWGDTGDHATDQVSQRSQRRFALTLRPQCVTALRPMSSGDRGLSSPGGWAARRSCFQPVRVTGRHSRYTRRRCKWHAGPDCRGHAPHCCSRIRMRGSFVDIAQRDPGIRTGGGDERVPECVRRYGLGDPVRVPAIERKPDVTRTSRLRHVTAQ